ncbi:MAG TPA: LD-carboxypeptidase, partial [Limnobacter sp.]|nr:LD-carboxypeptidase [Limnobacter sp.]
MSPSTSAKGYQNICLFSPSGALIDEKLLDRAKVALQQIGFNMMEVPQARLRHQRFAGTEEERMQGLHQAIANESASILMASRGGYGLARLLHQIDLGQIAGSLSQHGHLLCGHSDLTGLQLALLSAGARPESLL